MTQQYKLVKKQPVARFFYQGPRHSHPVRRTVLVVETTHNLITGHEVREGSIVRNFKDAPIKSYRKDRIAKVKEIDKRRVLAQKTPRNRQDETTLSRNALMSLITEGA